MISLGYFPRLICLLLATGMVGYTAGTLLASVAAPRALRRLERAGTRLEHPDRAVRWLLGLRLFPLFSGGLFAVGCLSSFLWLEQGRGAEQAGVGFLLCATAGATAGGVMLARVARAAWSSRRLLRRIAAEAEELAMPQAAPALVIADAAPLLALAGVWRPRLLVSRGLLDALTPEQLEAGLRHERAHQRAGDNWKRLLLSSVPALGLGSRLTPVERMWARLVEWSADEGAASGDRLRSLSLASTLITLARLGSHSLQCSTVSFLAQFGAGADRELADRVQRLLAVRSPAGIDRWGIGAAIGGLLLTAMLFQPAILHALHEVVEVLVH
ncbi:MAG TPA: M48 family metalloprotease [Terriglobales bacterium]|nr:M48 family metalloprotease [Terriglobales bacterium]